jgi:hypothetical protein
LGRGRPPRLNRFAERGEEGRTSYQNNSTLSSQAVTSLAPTHVACAAMLEVEAEQELSTSSLFLPSCRLLSPPILHLNLPCCCSSMLPALKSLRVPFSLAFKAEKEEKSAFLPFCPTLTATTSLFLQDPKSLPPMGIEPMLAAFRVRRTSAAPPRRPLGFLAKQTKEGKQEAGYGISTSTSSSCVLT